MQKEAAATKLTDETNNNLQVQNYRARSLEAYIKYLDFNYPVKRMATCTNTVITNSHGKDMNVVDTAVLLLSTTI